MESEVGCQRQQQASGKSLATEDGRLVGAGPSSGQTETGSWWRWARLQDVIWISAVHDARMEEACQCRKGMHTSSEGWPSILLGWVKTGRLGRVCASFAGAHVFM